MKIKTRLIVCMIVSALVLFAGFAVSHADDKPTITIGWSLPLTGDLGWIGEGMRDAALLAKEEIGTSNYNWKFIFEDDKLDPKNTATVGNKFVHIDKVDVTVAVGGSCGGAMSKLADQNKIVNVSVTTEPSVEEGDMNFGHWTPLPEQNIVLVEQIEKRGFEKVASFVNVSLNDYVSIHKDLAQRIKLVASGEVQNDQKDFRTEITKVLKADPDIIILCLRAPILDMLTRQLRELGYKGRLTAIESFAASKEKELYEGEFMVGGAEQTNFFKKAFQDKYEKEPKIGAANAYDIVKLVVSAIENSGVKGKPTPKQISDSMKKINYYPGALGTLRVQESGRIWSAATVQMIKDGQVIHIEP